MKLNRLSGCQTQRAIRITRGDRIQRKPLRRRDYAAGQTRAYHELVVGLELLQTSLVAQIAIILLIAAVKLDQLRVGIGDGARDRIGETFLQRAAQATAVRLDVLDRR